jgi:hypothetical protein
VALVAEHDALQAALSASAISTRKGGGFYGYKIRAAVCTTTGLPVAWETHTAKDAEVPVVPTRLDFVWANGIAVSTLAMDKGLRRLRPVRRVRTLRHPPHRPASGDAVRQGWQGCPAECDHGTWTFAGSDAKRGAAKYRCPTGGCSPASVWIKAGRLP